MRCFYYDVATETSAPSAEAVEMDAAEALSQWRSLSHEPGTFFGVYCGNGLVAQFLWEEDEVVQIDVPLVDRRGSLQKAASFDACCALLASLYDGADPAADPDLQFVAWEET